MARRRSTFRTLNSLGLWICNEFGRSGRLRVLEEPTSATVAAPTSKSGGRRTPTRLLLYRGTLGHSTGPTAPDLVEEAIPDAAGIAESFDAYRPQCSTPARSTSMTDLSGSRDPADRSSGATARKPDAATSWSTSSRTSTGASPPDQAPVGPTYDCFGVGDDDQVIYGYSGATPEFLINFPSYFPPLRPCL